MSSRPVLPEEFSRSGRLHLISSVRRHSARGGDESTDETAQIGCLIEKLGRTRDPADLQQLYALSSPRVYGWAKSRMTTVAAEQVLLDLYTTIWRESANRPAGLDGWTWFLTRAGRAVSEAGRC